MTRQWVDPEGGLVSETGSRQWVASGGGLVGERAVAPAAASASGTGAAAANGGSLATATGAATGAGGATAIGQSKVCSPGSAAGSAVAAAVGQSTAVATGTATGAGGATAIGLDLDTGVGVATGAGSAAAIGASSASALAASTGSGDGVAVGQSAASAVAAATGTGAAAAVSINVRIGAGSATGTGAAAAVGIPLATGAASATGTGAAAAVGKSLAKSAASATGTGAAAAVGRAIRSGRASAAGTAVATGVGRATVSAVASAAATAVATAVGRALARARASASGTAVATAFGYALTTVTTIFGVPDSALPVFSFRPNWRAGITERLEWLTDILTSLTSAEQRNSLRLTARRNFQVSIEPIEQERKFLDLFIRRYSAQEFMLPLWHDAATLDAAAASATSILTFDTTDREFVDGGMAILMGADAFSCEAVQIAAVTGASLILASPLLNNWPAGTTVHPLRRSWLSDAPKAIRQTDNFDIVPMQFLLSGPQDYDGGSEELPQYAGTPILSPAPNWSSTLDLTFARDLKEVDNKIGLRSVYDPAGREFTSQMHRWMLMGRGELTAFRRLMARLRGRQAKLWLPSFMSDITLAAAAAPGSTTLDVKRCGMTLVDYPALAITAAGEMLSLASFVGAPAAGVERVSLTTPLAGTLAAGDSLSSVDIGRIDSDAIEIHHETDSDGVAIIELPFRTFPDVRDGSGPSALPLETATMTDGACVTCDFPATGFPYSVSAVLPSPPPTTTQNTLGNAELIIPMMVYGPGCAPSTYSFNVELAGPVIAMYANGVQSMLIGTLDASIKPIVPFDNNYAVSIGGYPLSARFYYDGTNFGMEITNPDNHPVQLVIGPDAAMDYSLPLWGTPASATASAMASKWGVRLIQGGATAAGWNESAAFAHDFQLQVRAAGADIATPYQRMGHPASTYSPASYELTEYAIIGYLGSEFPPCHSTQEFPVFGPCT